MRTAPVVTVAAYTLLEAARNRLAWLVLLVVLAGLALSSLVSQVAVTESRAYQAGLLGAFLRLAMVFTAALFVVTSMVREQQDKGLELVLSMPLPRAAYLLGKLLGFSAVAAVLALASAATLLPFAAPAQVALWGASLACELVLTSALATLFVITFAQVLWSLSAVLAFYLLGRVIEALQLMGHGPLVRETAPAQQVVNAVIDALAYLLPELHRFTPSAWLAHGEGTLAALGPIAAQSAIYVALLTAAALFDFYRRNY